MSAIRSLTLAAIAAQVGVIGVMGMDYPRERETAPRRYNYEEPPPPPNPKADKRKANRVKQMQAKKQRRREMSGGKP